MTRVEPDLPRTALGRWRQRVRRTRGGRIAWRIVVTLLGVLIVAVGVVLLPLPGPGWVIIFAGLGVLATEYSWAALVLGFARAQLARWNSWLRRRSWPVKVLLSLLLLLLLAALAYAAWYVYLR